MLVIIFDSSECPAGAFKTSSGCRACPANTYSLGGTTTCTDCPQGTTSVPGSKKRSSCKRGEYYQCFYNYILLYLRPPSH